MEQEEQISQIQFHIKIDITNGTLFIKDIQNPNHLHTLLLNSQIQMNHSSGLTQITIIQDFSIFSQEQHHFNQDGVDNMPQCHSTQEKEHSKLEKIMDIHKMHSNKQLLQIPFLSRLKRKPHQLLILVYQKTNQLKMHHYQIRLLMVNRIWKNMVMDFGLDS